VGQVEFVGRETLRNIDQIVRENLVKRILLVTGKESYHCSGAKEQMQKHLSSVEKARFCEFDTNPRIEDVYRGVDLVKSFSPDLIVAIGGGSVIDMAKLINALSVNKLRDFLGNKKSINKGKTVIAIPTTTGTGSESTHFAVVYIDGKKHSIAHRSLLPDYAIVDPSLTYKSPGVLVASSGLDALSQAIESYWSLQSTSQSKGYAKKAISIILPNIVKATCEGSAASIEMMAIGAHLSGKAINISKTTAPHAISYSVSSALGIPHGHSVAVTLGYFFSINYPDDQKHVTDSRGADYLRSTMEELYKLLGCKNANLCHEFWNGLINDLGLEYDFYKLGFRENLLQWIINSINVERMRNNPIQVSKLDLKNIFRAHHEK